jgi:energy-coupling factor transporter transmembrane protein EcfT
MSSSSTSPANASPQVPAATLKQGKGWNPSPWSFLCLLLGVVLLCVHPGFIFVSAPLFLACFVLSIIAMARHRVASGVLMMIAVFTIAPFVTIAVFVHSVSSSIKSAQEEKVQALAKLTFEQVKGYRDGGYMYLKGTARNNSTSAVEFVKVVVDWLDKDGTVLDTNFTYVTALDKLEPGAAKSFSIMTPANAKMSNFRYRFSAD